MPPEKQPEIINNTLENEQDVSTITALQGVQTEVINTHISNLEEKIEWVEYQKTHTYEILKGTKTEENLLLVMNQPEFTTPEAIKKYGDTAEKRLEKIFQQINTTINKYLLSKFQIDGTKEQIPPTITEVLTPAIERQLMEFLKNNGNKNNISNLSLANGINFESFTNLLTSVGSFAGKATGMYTEGKKLINAIDFLSAHKQLLKDAKKSEVLRNPLKMKELLENPIWLTDTNPYEIKAKDVEIEFGQEEDFWMTEAQKEEIKDKIGNIEVVNSPRTTQLLLWLVEKADPFLDVTEKLSNQAMDLLDKVDWPLGIIKNVFWKNILKSVEKSKFLKGVLDVVLKVLGFSGGFDGLVKRRKQRKIDKELDDTKREQISEIFEEYLTHIPTTIPEANLLSNLFKSKVSAQAFATLQPYFNIDKTVLTSAIKDKLTDINSINPKVIKEAAGSAYITTTTKTEMVNGKQKQVKKETIDGNKFERDKDKIIEKYLIYMTKTLSTKPTFLQSIDTSAADQGSNTVAFTIVSSLFINKDNVIDGIEAKVFLPNQFTTQEPPTREETPPEISPTTSETSTTPEKQRYDGNLMHLDLVKENQTEFKKRVEEISNELEINPNRLMLIMRHESRLNHKAQNKIGATGLIQFTKKTAEGLWTTTEKLKNMSNIQQLDYVREYFLKYKGKIKSVKDLFLITFFPAAIPHSDDPDYVFETSELSAEAIARANPRWGQTREKLTMRDCDEHIQSIIQDNVEDTYQPQFA